MKPPAGGGATLGFGEFFGTPDLSRAVPGFALARLTALRGTDPLPEHTHTHAHLVLVLAGRYVTRARRIDRGGRVTLIYNPPGIRHRDTFREGPGAFFTLSVTRDRLLALAQRLPLPARPLALASGASVRLAERLALAFERRRSRASGLAGMADELIGGLAGQDAVPAGRHPAWLLDARRALHQRHGEPLTIRALAGALRVHPVHLIRAFRRAFGRTPGEFLRERRLGVAMSLLRWTDLPVADIALRVGFADQAHMTRSFTRGFGVPPAACRRIVRAGRFIPDKTRTGPGA